MRTPDQILNEELDKLNNAFIKNFYIIHRDKIVKIIEEIQKEAYDAGIIKAYSNR